MTTVTGKEAIRYGIGIGGWVLLLGFISGGVAGIGFIIAGGGTGIMGTVLGGLLFLIGGLIIISGLLGLLYKVIADANDRVG